MKLYIVYHCYTQGMTSGEDVIHAICVDEESANRAAEKARGSVDPVYPIELVTVNAGEFYSDGISLGPKAVEV